MTDFWKNFRLATLIENQLIHIELEQKEKYSVHVYLSEFTFSWAILDNDECFVKSVMKMDHKIKFYVNVPVNTKEIFKNFT